MYALAKKTFGDSIENATKVDLTSIPDNTIGGIAFGGDAMSAAQGAVLANYSAPGSARVQQSRGLWHDGFLAHREPADSSWRGRLSGVALAGIARAFPPAPHHLFYGMVRDEYCNPLNMEGAEVVLETSANVQVNGKIIPGLNPGVNYELKTPMDAGITSDLYKPTAMMPTVPFKLKVKIGQATYLPIEMLGDFGQIGLPGKDTRVELTLGEDADGDGLPNVWERALIISFVGKLGLDDINGGDDTDGDGLSNLNEYIAGTYAMNDKNGFDLGIVRMNADRPLLEFTAVRGRSYSRLRVNLDVNFLFASLVWGSVGFGYCIYGRRAQSLPSFLAGMLMIAASYFMGSALSMSLVCTGLMGVAYWLAKQGI